MYCDDEDKLKEPGRIIVNWLELKSTASIAVKLEIWLGTLVSQFPDARNSINGLTPAVVRNAFKMLLIFESVTF